MRPSIARGLALLLLFPFVVCAQNVPRPKEFYFDEDAAIARPVVAVPGDDEAVQQRLLRMIERNERNASAATAQLAHIAMASGRGETGRALYARVLDGLSRGGLRNSVHWNYGWDLYRDGDVEAAVAQWLAAYTSRPQNPEWVPPTLALGLWRLERRAEATAWYAAAVRTWPERWARPADFAALLPDWSADDHGRMRQVHAAWVEDAPSWP